MDSTGHGATNSMLRASAVLRGTVAGVMAALTRNPVSLFAFFVAMAALALVKPLLDGPLAEYFPTQYSIDAFVLKSPLIAATYPLRFGVFAALCHVAAEGVQGRPASIVGGAIAAVRLSVALLVVGAIAAVGIGGGMILCLLPGIHLLVVLSLIVPAVMVENRRAFDASGRSNTLVRSAYWPVVLVIAAVGIVYWAPNFAVRVFMNDFEDMFSVIEGPMGFGIFDPNRSHLLVDCVASLAWSAAAFFGALSVSALFLHLRTAHDNLRPPDVAKVFE